MYPHLKVMTTLAKARFRPKLNIEDQGILHLRVGITDIDLFLELNNARYFNYMEMGRWDYGYRVGFLRLLKEKKWGIAVGGASVRYRRRIPLFRRFTLSTRLICHDGRWLYFLQETNSRHRICSSALMKIGVTSKNGLIPAPDVTEAMNINNWNPVIPDWVAAWVGAESRRPWPSGG